MNILNLISLEVADNWIDKYTDLSIILIGLGVLGIVINRKSMLITLICIELTLYGLDLFSLAAGILNDDLSGQIFALFILTLAAAESAIALALIISFFRSTNSIIISVIEKSSKNNLSNLKKRLKIKYQQ